MSEKLSEKKNKVSNNLPINQHNPNTLEIDNNLKSIQVEPSIAVPEDELKTTRKIALESEAELELEGLKGTEAVYLPRTLWQKILPSLVLLTLMLVYFIFCYMVAEDQEVLLGFQFLMGVPFFIGATAVAFANYRRPITITRVFALIFWLILGILLICIPVLKEGIICIVIASPILYIAMLIGGILMNKLCQKFWHTKQVHSKSLYSVALLPLLVLFVPLEQSPQTYHVSNSTVINATPEQVWQIINHIEDIEADTFYQKSKLLPFMQVPTPKSAITVLENKQLVRKCQWQGDIYFDEPIITQTPNRQLRWKFVFYPDSVPPQTLDDHVTINGEHFKLLHGQYDLEAIDNNSTKLTFNVTYRITTNMNFYAGFWGEWVMNEFVEDTLGLYKRRLETI